MKDINYFRLRQIPTIITFVIVAFWLKDYDKDISRDQITEVTGVIASNIEKGHIDGANHYHQFRLDTYDRWFRLEGNPRTAVHRRIGLDKFEQMTKQRPDLVFKLGVLNEELQENKKIVSIIYMSINGTEITNYEDFERLVNEDLNLAHRIYWIGFVIAGLFLLKAILVLNFPNKRERLIKPNQVSEMKLDKTKLIDGFKINENGNAIEISDSKRLVVRFDFDNKCIAYRKLWFYLKSPFDRIEDYGISFNDGFVDFMIRLKKGLEFKLMNTKFDRNTTFIELDDEDKYMIEKVLFSIFNKITHPNNVYTK